MRERKMFFPPALRLAAVAIALSAAALALPLPVFAVLDRAAGHSIAVQQDAEALSPAGRSCAAARELYCWRMTWQNTSRTMVEPDSTPASTAPTLAAVQQLQAAGVLPAAWRMCFFPPCSKQTVVLPILTIPARANMFYIR